MGKNDAVSLPGKEKYKSSGHQNRCREKNPSSYTHTRLAEIIACSKTHTCEVKGGLATPPPSRLPGLALPGAGVVAELMLAPYMEHLNSTRESVGNQ